MLCKICLDIFQGSFPAVFIKHHGSYQSLQRSALADCDICRIVRDEISSMLPPGAKSVRVSAKLEHLPDDENDTILLKLETTSPRFVGEWFFHCEPTEKEGETPDAEKPYDYSDWNASMACARAWLAECIENHTDCPASRPRDSTVRYTSGVSHPTGGPTTSLPARLLEIGQPEADQVRLLLSSELDSTSQYATLSHCWGKSQTLRLTSNSFERFRDGVAISDLAKTFQDAISTARSLGIELLWIDSFCIFQDSREDWAQEAGLMSQVYRNSYLNIAASVAVDSDAGCFHDRAPTVEPHAVHTAWTNHPNGIYRIYDQYFWPTTFKRMPLQNRAWFFQENVLAHRVLSFCGTQLFWECYGLRACETWPTGLPANMKDAYSLKSPKRSGAIEIFGPRGVSPVHVSTNKDNLTASFRRLWRKLIVTYSSCDLTFSSDKLIALSGIAKYMERLLDIEYCAGLWSHDLAQGLAWYRGSVGSSRPVFPPNADHIPYRAPSWSWACVDGGILWEKHRQSDINCLVDVIRWEVQSATGERTGAVTGATLQLSGYLKTIKLGSISGTERDFAMYCDGKWNKVRHSHVFFDRRPPSVQLHFMPIFSIDYEHPYGRDDPDDFYCLLLTAAPDTHGWFQRVGIFRTRFDHWSVDWSQLPHFENESWFEYESVNDEGKYTITII